MSKFTDSLGWVESENGFKISESREREVRELIVDRQAWADRCGRPLALVDSQFLLRDAVYWEWPRYRGWVSERA